MPARDGAHSRKREEAEPGDSISERGCEGLPPLQRRASAVRAFGSTSGDPPRTRRSAPPLSRAPAVGCIAAERTDRYAAPSGTITAGGGRPARGKRRERLAAAHRARSRKGGDRKPARIPKKNGTKSEADGNDAEIEPEASQSRGSVPMPRAGERAFLGPGHSALHQRILHPNVGRTAGEPQRLHALEKSTPGRAPRTHPVPAPRVTPRPRRQTPEPPRIGRTSGRPQRSTSRR